jgi:hypothetical protein
VICVIIEQDIKPKLKRHNMWYIPEKRNSTVTYVIIEQNGKEILLWFVWL